MILPWTVERLAAALTSPVHERLLKELSGCRPVQVPYGAQPLTPKASRVA